MVVTRSDAGGYLTFTQGDLIALDDVVNGEKVLESNWSSGRNERTGERGDFATELVYVLPAASRPPQSKVRY